VPHYMGSHLDTYCFENIMYQLYMVTLAPVHILVFGVWGSDVVCVFTVCTPTAVALWTLQY